MRWCRISARCADIALPDAGGKLLIRKQRNRYMVGLTSLEIEFCNLVITAADTAKRKLVKLKDARAQLLADTFRANKKADTKAIDEGVTMAACWSRR